MQTEKLEKFLDAAVNLRIATLRAKEQGITDYNKYEDFFYVLDDDNFENLIKGRKYTIQKSDCPSFEYEYKATISGLVFKNMTNDLLFEGDEEKVKKDV